MERPPRMAGRPSAGIELYCQTATCEKVQNDSNLVMALPAGDHVSTDLSTAGVCCYVGIKKVALER